MKRKLLLLTTCLVATSQLLFAQNSNVVLQNDVLKSTARNTIVGKATAGTGSRLISYMIAKNNGASYIFNDSANIVYSGTRGGDIKHQPLKYDNAMEWTYNTTTTSWDNEYKLAQTFDANNNITDRVQMNWNTVTSSWVNSDHDIYTYDGMNNMLTDISQNWNTVTSSWDNSQKNINTYDANNNQITQVMQNWNTVTSTWDNSTKYLNTYNAANKMTQQIVQSWNTGTSSWDNGQRYTYTYDANNNMLTSLNAYWNTGTSSWDNGSLVTYTYGASNEMLTEIDQNWNTGTSSWDNTKKKTYSNFSGINPQMEIDQNWNTGTSSWDNTKRYQNTYNTYGQYLTIVVDSWNIGGFWQAANNDVSDNLHYETYATDVKSLTAKGGEANIYPVPANNLLNIDLNWNEPQAFTVSIIDLQGRISHTWNVAATSNYHTAIDVSQMPLVLIS